MFDRLIKATLLGAASVVAGTVEIVGGMPLGMLDEDGETPSIAINLAKSAIEELTK